MTDLGRIFASNPVNATAARVLGGGVHYDGPAIPENHFHSVGPPTIVPPRLHPRTAGFVDLTGHQFGWLTVLGFYGSKNLKKKALWVVRCNCGNYETRTAKAVKNPANNQDACIKCRQTLYLRRQAAGV